MSSLFVALFAFVTSSFRTRTALQAEILALRHQLAVFQKNAPLRLRLQRSDRLLWVLLSRWWPGWHRSLHIVRPDRVIAWHRRAFAWYWTRKSRRRPGRPNVPAEIRGLIRKHEPSEPVVGSTPHSRGVAQVRDRGSTIDCGQISSPPAEATFPDLANFLSQSHGADGLHRLLCGADSDLPGSVCVRGVVQCSASYAALSSDRTPQPGVDDAADAGSVSMGPPVPISSARSRCDLRRGLGRHDERPGDGGSD